MEVNSPRCRIQKKRCMDLRSNETALGLKKARQLAWFDESQVNPDQHTKRKLVTGFLFFASVPS